MCQCNQELASLQHTHTHTKLSARHFSTYTPTSCFNSFTILEVTSTKSIKMTSSWPRLLGCLATQPHEANLHPPPVQHEGASPLSQGSVGPSVQHVAHQPRERRLLRHFHQMINAKVCGEEELAGVTQAPSGKRVPTTPPVTEIVVSVDSHFDVEFVEDWYHMKSFRYRAHCKERNK